MNEKCNREWFEATTGKVSGTQLCRRERQEDIIMAGEGMIRAENEGDV